MMRTLRRTWNRVLGSLSRHDQDGDLAEELESHLQLHAEDEMRRGVPPDEAYRRARLRFGSVELAKERYRDQRGLPVLDLLIQDLRHAWRGLSRNPGFAATAILSLGIGVGANTAMFSLVDSVILRPLAYADPQRLFGVRELLPHMAGERPIPVNPLHARAWTTCPAVEAVGLMGSARAQLTSGGDPVFVPAARVTHDLFAVLGVAPMLGRAFLPEEETEGRDRVVILSETLWRSRFNADRSLVGRAILLDGNPYEVIGILPAWFRLPYNGGTDNVVTNVRFEIFRPLALTRKELLRPMGNFNYGAVVRVKRGSTVEQAVAEINLVQATFPRQTGTNVVLKAVLTPLHELVTGGARPGLWMLAAAVGAVLLIVCVNLANLLLSRVATRNREAAIRTALGASRARQFSHALTESLLLSLSGGILGLVLANLTLQLLLAATTLEIPRLEEVRIDTGVLLFAFLLAVLTGLLIGVLPAWRSAASQPQDALRAGSQTVTDRRSRLRLREVLIGLEVGASAALLIVAGLLASSLARVLHVDKGFDVNHVLTLDVGLAGNAYAEPVTREKFFDRLLAKVSAIPGVDATGLVTALPTRGETWLDPIYLEGGTHYSVNNRYTSPGYFRAMNIAIRNGQAFEDRDRGRDVAVLSERAAKLLWPGDPNPVGRRFVGEDGKMKTLLGIVADVRASLQNEPPPTAYYPYWQRAPGGAALVLRTTADPNAIAGAVHTALRSEDPQLPLPAIRTMEDVVDRTVAERRLLATIMVVFAVSALLVASLGIYGVVSYSVARRRNEIGIRLALGAQRVGLLGMVMRQSMAPVVVGLSGGVAVAVLVGRTTRGLLFGVQPTDPFTIAGVTMTLLIVGVLASLIPAARAASTDVIAALRFD